MRNSTLLFLVKREGGGNGVANIAEVCLAMKKRGFGMGRWNGVGGKVNEGESIEGATHREANEEVGIVVKDMSKVAELAFTFPAKPDWNQLVHVYVSSEWENDPVESEEMKPEWFAVANIPFKDMWPDDIFWLPKVIEGNLVKGAFSFGEGDSILEQRVEVIDSL